MKHIIFALSGLLALSAGHLSLAAEETPVENQTPAQKSGGGEISSKLSTISISEQQYHIGAAIGSIPIPSFGIGHAVQGRYMSRGWIFTAGEVVSFRPLN